MVKRKKLALYATLCAATLLLAVWVATPYYRLYQLAIALDRRDADQFNAMVDYAAFRKSLREEISRTIPQGGLDSEAIHQFIETTFRPEHVGRLVESGKLPELVVGLTAQAAPSASGLHQKWAVRWVSWQALAITRVSPGESDALVSDWELMFQRQGGWDWKLVGLRTGTPPPSK